MTAFHETPRMSAETEQNAASANLQKDGAGHRQLIDRLSELHKRVIACWQSPTGQPPPRRARSMEPKFDDCQTIIFATIELERQAHDLRELRETIAFIRSALPVLRNVLGTIGLRIGEAKAEEMIAALMAASAALARAREEAE